MRAALLFHIHILKLTNKYSENLTMCACLCPQLLCAPARTCTQKLQPKLWQHVGEITEEKVEVKELSVHLFTA